MNDDIPYYQETSRKYGVTGPALDNEIELNFNNEERYIWLNKSDVILLAKRFGLKIEEK